MAERNWRSKIAFLIRLFKRDKGSLDRALSHLSVIEKVSSLKVVLNDTNFARPLVEVVESTKLTNAIKGLHELEVILM